MWSTTPTLLVVQLGKLERIAGLPFLYPEQPLFSVKASSISSSLLSLGACPLPLAVNRASAANKHNQVEETATVMIL